MNSQAVHTRRSILVTWDEIIGMQRQAAARLDAGRATLRMTALAAPVAVQRAHERGFPRPGK